LSLFITFEGIEGSGKTTQIVRIKNYLTQKRIPCEVTREPGGTSIGEKIRKILLDPSHSKMVPLCELLLYEASRAQHVHDVIKPLLEKGIVVICDRFSDASIAYQAYGRGLDLKFVQKLNRIASQGLKPDITFILDCPSGLGLKRAIKRNKELNGIKEDRFERENILFHKRVREGYLSLAKKDPRRIKVIDTRLGEEKVFEKIRDVIDKLLVRQKICHSKMYWVTRNR
jgi:dTMP kinase